jgi:hypothetical protein
MRHLPEAMAYFVRVGGGCCCEDAASDLPEIILAAKTSVGPFGRSDHLRRSSEPPLAHCTPPCDNPIALGMRALISSSGCHCRSTSFRSFRAYANCCFWPCYVKGAFLQNGPHHVHRSLSLLHRHQYHSTPIYDEEPTIYALSTAPGKAAIAVIRVSGPACRQVLRPIRLSTTPH